MFCCFGSCQVQWHCVRTLSWTVKLFFAADVVCLVTWLLCTKLLFLLIWKLIGWMWRITNVCRFRLLEVLPAVTTCELQRIALLLNLINRNTHAKRVLVSFADTCTLEIEQLGTISSCRLPVAYSAFRWGDRKCFSFPACFTGNFLFCCDTEIKSKGDMSLTRGRICFQISICYGESSI